MKLMMKCDCEEAAKTGGVHEVEIEEESLRSCIGWLVNMLKKKTDNASDLNFVRAHVVKAHLLMALMYMADAADFGEVGTTREEVQTFLKEFLERWKAENEAEKATAMAEQEAAIAQMAEALGIKREPKTPVEH